jgi:hypothetical protein
MMGVSLSQSLNKIDLDMYPSIFVHFLVFLGLYDMYMPM